MVRCPVPQPITGSRVLFAACVALLAVAGSPAVSQAQSGLVAAWGFNEGVGTTVADASGNSNTGSISGAVWSTQGRYGNALSFDGVNDVVLVPNATSLNLTTGMTLSAWVFPTAAQGGWRAIVQREVDAYFLHAGNGGGALHPAAGGIFDGVDRNFGTPNAIGVNAWTHLAVTYDGTTMRLFVNGTQVATAAQTGTIQTPNSPLRIGGNSPYTEFFLGRIDDVRVYNRALTPTEIQSDMAVSVGGGAPPDVTVPTISITSPTANPTHSVTATPVTLGGTAGDNVGVTQVSWVNNRGGSGTATGTTSWSAANIALLSGDNVVTVTARDAAGNLATDVITVTYTPPDVTVPTISITSPTANPTHGVTTTPVTLGGTAGDNVGVTQVSWVNNRGDAGTATGTTSWSAANITLLSGDNVVTVTARDAAGNTASDVITVTYTPADVTVPTVSITTPTPNPTHSVTTTPVTLGGTAGDNVGVTQVSWVNDRGGAGTATGTTSWSAANIALLSGDNVVTVTARDAAGNTASDVITVTYTPADVTVPTVSITTPTPNPTHSVTATPVTLGGTAGDNVGVTQVSWTNDRGGSGTASGTTSWSAANIALLNGDNILTVMARDAAGNTATDVITVTFTPPADVTVPTISITTPTTNPTHSVTTTPLTIGGTAGDNVGVTQVSWTNDRGGSGTAAGTTSWSAANITLLSGDNVVTVTARDAAGNTASDVITVTYTPADVTVPTVSITTPTPNPTHSVTTTPVTLGGTAGDNVGVTQVSWTNDRGGSGTAAGTTSWSAANIALLSGDNVLTVTASDAAGNTATDVMTVNYQPPATPSGLVAAWGFNEGAGTTVADASGNNNTGSITGPVWSTQGRYGTALSFDGSNDIVLVPNAPSLTLTTGMTLSAWVFPTAAQGGWRAIVQKEVDAYFLHASYSGGALHPTGGGIFSGSDAFVGAPSAIAVNAWTHVAATYDGTAIRVFVNGAQVATTPRTGQIQNTSTPLRIGGNSPYTEFFLGRIDDVRIYSRALTATEIQNDMAVSVGGGAPPGDVTVPTISITTPTANPAHSVTTTPVTLGGTAGDNVGVTQVSWANNRGGAGNATGTTSWSAANIALLSGDNVVTVTARDAAGNLATDVITVTYTPPDATVPTISITTPTANPTHSVTTTPVTLGGTAGDNVGVTQVTWTNDRGGSGTASGTTTWSAANIALLSGDNVVTVTARDAAGNTATDVITVAYAPTDVTVPTVSITTPTANPTHSVTTTPVTLGGTAGDDVGVTQVSWVNDRGGSGTATGTTSWSATNIALLSGDNVLTVTARDAAGNTATDVITVTYEPPATPLGLVAAWGFNEGAGTTVADASGNNNTGTISGPVWSTQGRYGSALSFDGTNDVVLVPNAPSLNVTTAMTVSAWVFPTAAQGGWRAIVQREVDAYFLHASHGGGALRPAAGGIFNGVDRNFGAPSAIAVSTWTHLAATYDGATMRLFVNGAQVATMAQTGSLQTPTSPLRIGGNSPYTEFFLGRIDDVRLYNRTLTATEIQNDMAVSVSAAPPRLTIVQPGAGSTIVGTTVNVAYTTSGDLVEVDHVHFKLDANPEVMDLSLDGAYTFSNVPVGPHTLTGYLVRADHSKILNTDASVSFSTASTGDTTPPTVAVTAPASGATLTGTVTVTAAASDNSGAVAGVQFLLDGASLGPEDTSAPYSLDWNTLTTTNATHSLTARARDGAGNQRVSTAVVVTVANGASSDPAVVGQWSPVLNWPLVSIHMSLMPNGEVLVWDDHTFGEGAAVFNPTTQNVTLVPFDVANLFCAGHSLLADGRVFVAGGHLDGHVGITNTTIFNPLNRTWTSVQPMTYARWYPTVTALPDGRLLTLAGEINCDDCNALIPEVFAPATGTWSRLTSAPLDLPYYPFTFVLPDGRILVAGSNKRAIPTYTLDVASQTWTTLDPAALHGGSAVMYAPGKIMKSGLGRDPDLVGVPSVATTYVLDMTAAVPAWRETAAMAFARTEHNLTLLPDGTVLTIGGGVNSDVFDPNAPVMQPELWDPATESWRLLAAMQRPRIYHSTAVLLPDGRVLSAGGGRYGPNNLDAQFYSPPYLFKGPRPTISSAPATIAHGAEFTVATPDAGTIASVSLVRLGSVTHAFDANQRYLTLTFQPDGGGLTVQAPASANLAPPGHYMLFILNGNGVPSLASMVRIP